LRRKMHEQESDRQMAESQLAELHNIRVLLVEARAQAQNLAEHRRRRLEAPLRAALREIDAQISDLRNRSG
jgi:hypothetical protein